MCMMLTTISNRTPKRKMSGFKMKRSDRKPSNEPKMKSLNSLLGNKEEYGESESFQIRSLHVSELLPGSFKKEYFVRLKNGDYEFCCVAVFEDDDGDRLTLKMWKLFEKLIRITAAEFVELSEAQQDKAFEDIEKEARYNIIVKFTSGEFKLTALEPDEGSQGADQGAAQDGGPGKQKCAKK
jgi:hypothetical protein